MNSIRNEVLIHPNIIDITNISALINRCLPKQGSIEIQHDQEGKEHILHTHDTDETIIVLNGVLRFYWPNGEKLCVAGDVIELPKGVSHGSIALSNETKYIITFEHIDLK